MLQILSTLSQILNLNTHQLVRMRKLLNKKKNYEYDKISVKNLKLSAPFISSPLTFIQM